MCPGTVGDILSWEVWFFLSLTCLSVCIGRYILMMSCWDADTTKRPSFSDLVSTFDNLLSAAHVSRVNKHMIGP